MNLPQEIEAFRATHDCQEYAWFVEKEEDKTSYICKGCDKKVEL